MDYVRLAGTNFRIDRIVAVAPADESGESRLTLDAGEPQVWNVPMGERAIMNAIRKAQGGAEEDPHDRLR